MEMVNVKTWSKTRVTGSGGTTSIAVRDLLIAIKNHLKTVGWSVVASCDGNLSFGAADYWIDYSDIVHAFSPSKHSWIVLSNSAICPGYQLCIDCDQSSTMPQQFKAFVSVDGVGFTGGSLTVRPAAADAVLLNMNGQYWINYGSGTTPSANIWTSSDYSATKIVLGPTTVRGVWWFVRPIDPKDWWLKPNLSMINYGTCVHTEHDTDTEFWTTGIVNGQRTLFGLGTIMIGAVRALTTAGVAGSSGDYGGNWPCSPMWAISNQAVMPGMLGFVPDQWWTHSNATLALGDTFPGDGSKAQVVIGKMAFGNDGTDLTL